VERGPLYIRNERIGYFFCYVTDFTAFQFQLNSANASIFCACYIFLHVHYHVLLQIFSLHLVRESFGGGKLGWCRVRATHPFWTCRSLKRGVFSLICSAIVSFFVLFCFYRSDRVYGSSSDPCLPVLPDSAIS